MSGQRKHPDFSWYSAESTRLRLNSPRCPFASVHACPRYYQSLSLLGGAGCTSIPKPEDQVLEAKWKKHPLWPATMEQTTSISGGGGEKNAYNKFCPEVAFDTFGLFATFLGRHVGEIDRDLAAARLAKGGAAHDDPRWVWAFVTPQHYSECPLYSPLASGHAVVGLGASSHFEDKNMKATQESITEKRKIFISYSHKDKKFLNELLQHLKPFERNGQLSAWSDSQIKPGDKWYPEISNALTEARVAVLLVSPSFLSSDFIDKHELGPLLKKADEGGVRIIWVPVRACSWKKSGIAKFQAAHSPDKPLAQMNAERDTAWVTICEKIEEAMGPS
jgi:hypothetical protein